MKFKYFFIAAAIFGGLLASGLSFAGGGFDSATESGERAVQAAEQAALANDESQNDAPADSMIEWSGPADPGAVVNEGAGDQNVNSQ